MAGVRWPCNSAFTQLRSKATRLSAQLRHAVAPFLLSLGGRKGASHEDDRNRCALGGAMRQPGGEHRRGNLVSG